MARAGQRDQLIIFERATATENDYGEEVLTWGEHARRMARVIFGPAQEKREAAQESGVQTATFICERSAVLDAVTIEDRINYLGSSWDITGNEPLTRKEIRFTGTRVV